MRQRYATQADSIAEALGPPFDCMELTKPQLSYLASLIRRPGRVMAWDTPEGKSLTREDIRDLRVPRALEGACTRCHSHAADPCP